jgi:hypothetical protein
MAPNNWKGAKFLSVGYIAYRQTTFNAKIILVKKN